jgi:hypothetical protein
MLTQARLKELLSYNPETGDFTNLKSGKGRKPVGAVVGSVSNSGYWTSMIDGKNYQHHRLVWLYVHGEFPRADLDHRDGNRANNRLINLREATRSENCQNASMKQNNTSGVTGVRQVGNRWRTMISLRGVHRHIGYYSTRELAEAAYLAAKREYHEFQPVPRNLVFNLTSKLEI